MSYLGQKCLIQIQVRKGGRRIPQRVQHSEIDAFLTPSMLSKMSMFQLFILTILDLAVSTTNNNELGRVITLSEHMCFYHQPQHRSLQE